jgi:hypothetical protein
MRKSLVILLILLTTASIQAQNVLYSNNFENGVGDATIYGNGQVVTENAPFGKVFHNAAGGQGVRANYLRLPVNIFANLQSSGSKQLTIAFWVNRATAVNYYWTPIFTAYGSGPNASNSWPMLALQSRLWAQVNNAGWSDFTAVQNVLGTNKESTLWLDDNAWHYYTAVFTETNVKIYIDGVIQNEWNLNGDPAGGSVSGLFSNGSALTYIALGGNQAWNWADPDPAYKFDDLVIYSSALTQQQINNNIADKYTMSVTANTNTSSMSSCADCDVIVDNGALLTVNASRTFKTLTVKPGAKLTINSGFSLTSGIILESDASGTATLLDANSTPTVNATVKQYTQAGRNWYISSPVSNASYSVLNKGHYVAQFNEVSKLWETVNSGTLTPGKGYIQVAAANQGTTGAVSFTGTTNAGNVTVNLTRTGTTQAGFNLVGNPYPSYLDWSAVAAANTNVLPTMWLRTKKTEAAGGAYTFATVNVAVPSNPVIVTNDANTAITRNIPPMQAYWVRLVENAQGNTFSVSNTMRLHADISENKFKAPLQSVIPLIRLQVSDGLFSDETLLYFYDNASEKYDRYDSPKMSNGSSTQPEIFTIADNERLVINGMGPVTGDRIVPLGVLAPKHKLLNIFVKELVNCINGYHVTLTDHLTGDHMLLNESSQYQFYVHSETDMINRFSLSFKAPGSISSLEEHSIANFRIFSANSGQISIEAPGGYRFSVINLMGQIIHEDITSVSQSAGNIHVVNAIPAGLYIVKVRRENQKPFTSRVYVK